MIALAVGGLMAVVWVLGGATDKVLHADDALLILVLALLVSGASDLVRSRP